MANFRARARTVDLLGRQQIAGIPTAISELFKNAHDAYAERVDVDFVREDQLFVLRDDGVGMTGDTFADRWLVLGTESKVRGQASRPRPRPGFLERPVLGEKGIGRLAIASIGPALLVLTRPLADSDDPTPVYVAFLHWGLFELPAINLDQIDIPVENLGAEVPDAQAVRKLVDAFAANLDALTDDADHDSVSRIRRDLEAFDVDPRTRERELGGPSLARDGHGTHFYVKPTDNSLAAGIDEHRDDRAADVVATLIGFSETMLPDSPAPTIATHFRDHRNGVEDDLLSPGAFFTPEEFERADHRIEGSFTVDGTFEGTVSVYGEDPVAYRLSWPGAGGKDLDCGAFDLNLALVQPDVAESRMSGPDLAALRRKMIKLGGLYVYRDRIRILPYGRPENDWLDIEQERSKHAGRAFLSHRRMFGEVSLTSDHNRGLEEKAGREGFRDNRAYRQFRDLLRYFLYTGIVADFFLEGGVYSDAFLRTKEDLERKAKARKERTERARKKRASYATRLQKLIDRIDAGQADEDFDQAVEQVRHRLKRAQTSTDIQVIEREAHSSVGQIARSFDIEQPRGFGLDNELRAAWSHYESRMTVVRDKLLPRASRAVGDLVAERLRQVGAAPSAAQRLRSLLDDTAEGARDRLGAEALAARVALEDVETNTMQLIDASSRTLDETIDRTIGALADTGVNGDLADRLQGAERPILEAAARETEGLTALTAQLRAISTVRDASGLAATELEALDALEEELLMLRERGAAELELAQLGMGIQIVGHEFNASVGAVRGALRQLKPWADRNEGLRRPYQDLRTNFEHLEGYLRLLAPLQRRLNRRRARIYGREIESYLRQLFGARFDDEHQDRSDRIEFAVTPAFAEHEVVGYRSTIYPAFVAIVDNALFWVREGDRPRWIRLDADEDAMIVTNSGPTVRGQDRERIFDLGISRKPGGQGLGLYVVRESLRAHDFGVTVVEIDGRTAFRIEPLTGDDDDD
jgi:hypothetical protein